MPTSFDRCLKIEENAKRLLKPFVRKQYGSVPEEVPNTFDDQAHGDWIITEPSGFRRYIELKAEEDFTGNLFLETWSNWHTSRYGWLLTTKADDLWYVFLDIPELYQVRLPELRFWLWGAEDDVDSGHVHLLREVTQQKHEQHNMTKGFLLPVKLAERIPTFRTVSLKRAAQ